MFLITFHKPINCVIEKKYALPLRSPFGRESRELDFAKAYSRALYLRQKGQTPLLAS